MKRSVIVVLGAIAICMLWVGTLFSQAKKGGSDPVAAITALENEGVKADLAGDKSFIQKNATDDFIAGLSFGEWQDKASMIKDMADPANNKTQSESISDLKVTPYGNTAIARYTETYDATRHGEHVSRSVLCTDTWVKQGAAWKEAASHCSQQAQK